MRVAEHSLFVLVAACFDGSDTVVRYRYRGRHACVRRWLLGVGVGWTCDRVRLMMDR